MEFVFTLNNTLKFFLLLFEIQFEIIFKMYFFIGETGICRYRKERQRAR